MNKVINILCIGGIIVLVNKLVDLQYNHKYVRDFNTMSVKEQYKELDCLTENIYYEASGEPVAGKIAVAQLTLNRVESSKRSKRFKDSICKVVYQGSEFSWVADKPRKLVNINKHVYNESREVAKKVLFEGERLSMINKPNVLYYHAEYVKPSWASEFKLVGKIGKHLYYERYENGKW